MTAHDPAKFASDLSAKLATRSRHICLFFGAGTARACGLPDIAQLRDRVLARLSVADRTALTGQLDGRNLEEVLSRLRRITALLSGTQSIDGLTGAQAKSLDGAICQAIVQELGIQSAIYCPSVAWHHGLRAPGTDCRSRYLQ